MHVAIFQWADKHTVMINRTKISLKTLTELLVGFCHIFAQLLDTGGQYSEEFLKVKLKRGPL